MKTKALQILQKKDNEYLSGLSEENKNKQLLELMNKDIELKKVENHLIQKAKKEKFVLIGELQQKNCDLNLNLLKQENEHYLQLKKMKYDNDLKRLEIHNEHTNAMQKLDLVQLDLSRKINDINLKKKKNIIKLNQIKIDRNLLKYKYKNKIEEEDIRHLSNMQDIDIKNYSMELNHNGKIIKDDLETKKEILKIENEIEINKIKIENKFKRKILKQQCSKMGELIKQETEYLVLYKELNKMISDLSINN